MEYFIRGKRHRIGGPAVIQYDTHGVVAYEEWWIDNERYDKREFDEFIKVSREIQNK